jgi:uncharacterized membrane protein
MTLTLEGGSKMQKAKKILPILVSAVAIVTLTMAPALAKDSKTKKSRYSPTKAAAESTASNHDERPGPAWRTFNGTLKKIEGNAYTVEDYEGNHVRLYVGQGTKHLKQKKVGDTVRAEITRGGFANSIQ